jgi:hypothetical protein
MLEKKEGMKITRNTQGVKGPTKGIYIDSK